MALRGSPLRLREEARRKGLIRGIRAMREVLRPRVVPRRARRVLAETAPLMPTRPAWWRDQAAAINLAPAVPGRAVRPILPRRRG